MSKNWLTINDYFIVMNDMIFKLKLYACDRIGLLAGDNGRLLAICTLLCGQSGDVHRHESVLTDAQAEAHGIWPSNEADFPGRQFDPATRAACFTIARLMLDIATETYMSDTMLQVARYLHPLFSQDDATIQIGFDLVEYMDWYFADDLSIAEKSVNRQKLLNEWATLMTDAE